MGNKAPIQCEFEDEKGIRCLYDRARWGVSDIKFCRKHGDTLLREKVRELNAILRHELESKYGEKFVREVEEMYSTTPIPRIKSEFEKIVKSNNLVDDCTLDKFRYSQIEGRTVFQNDMDRLQRIFLEPVMEL